MDEIIPLESILSAYLEFLMKEALKKKLSLESLMMVLPSNCNPNFVHVFERSAASKNIQILDIISGSIASSIYNITNETYDEEETVCYLNVGAGYTDMSIVYAEGKTVQVIESKSSDEICHRSFELALLKDIKERSKIARLEAQVLGQLKSLVEKIRGSNGLHDIISKEICGFDKGTFIFFFYNLRD